MKKSNILMVMPFQNSFITSDIEILSERYSIKKNCHNWTNKTLAPINMILQFFSILFSSWNTKAIIIEFGGYWSLIPSIFGKIFRIPVLIVLHGTDCAKLPNINYGSLRKTLIRFSCNISYKLATCLLPVSKSLIYTKNDYNSKYIYQGVKHHFPEIKTPYKVIPNGLDTEFWKPSDIIEKEKNRFIAVFSQEQFILKGGDLIIDLAKRFPENKFYIAGVSKANLNYESPKNVHFLGRLFREELRNEYRKSEFHLQLSMFEGFGLSLCEAMLCNCIPIGSSVNVIPEIIGDTGFVLHKKDINKLSEIIDKTNSIEDKEALGKKARERIIANYNNNIRQEELLKIIKSL